MTFTLNAGEFDLGGGFVGRGNILIGEVYVVGTATTGVQGLLNTSGLEGLSYSHSQTYQWYTAISFRESYDNLTQNILAPIEDNDNNNSTAWSGRGSPVVHPIPSILSDYARFHLCLHSRGDSYQNQTNNFYFSYLNASQAQSKILVSSIAGSQFYEAVNGVNLDLLLNSGNWRFLARDHATALTHYPTTTEEGSVFAASCINSATQYGLWIAGAVGNRNGYFNQRQGDFAIVLLVNGSNIYFSVFSPAAENSTARNDTRLRGINIIPAPGQSGDDRFSELLLFRDQGNGYSERLGTVPGSIYVDMNKSENASLNIGDNLTIEPGAGTTYGLTNKGAIVAARWGLDISGTVSNTGSLFTLNTVSLPTSATLAAGNRNRWILENNQRIRFTATPPTGLDTLTDYWVRDWDRIAFTFQLSASEGGAAIVPGSNGTSTLTRFAPLIAMACYKE